MQTDSTQKGHVPKPFNSASYALLAHRVAPQCDLALRRRPGALFEYAFEDFEFVNHQHRPAICAPVAV